jgi:polar amino acid transport system permease protein
MTWDFGGVAPYLPDLVSGLELTVGITIGAIALGVPTGLFLAAVKLTGVRWAVIPASLYVDFFRTTPPVIQILWAFYVLPALMSVPLDPIPAVILALGLNAGAFMSEIFRSGLLGVPRGQSDAARVLGLSRLQAFRHVILPQAISIALPPLTVLVMLTLKGTSLAAVIAVNELTHRAYLISSKTFHPLEVFTVVAIAYFAITYPIGMVARYLERRLRRSERPNLARLRLTA